jgi:hypothetical protein
MGKDSKDAGEPPAIPPGAFHFDSERLRKVGEGLLRRDILDCKTPDIKHAADALAHLIIINDLAPGFLDGFFALFIPHFTKMHNKAVIGEAAQKRADAEGFGNEWREAIEAGNSPRQKDYLHKMSILMMKAFDLSEPDAIRAMAEQSGRDIDDIGRSIRRSKKKRG